MKKIYTEAKKYKKRILFPEASDERIIDAIKIILHKKIAIPVIFGDNSIIKKLKAKRIPYTNIEIIGVSAIKKKSDKFAVEVLNINSLNKDKYAQLYFKARQGKCSSINEARKKIDDMNYLGCLMVKHGEVDGMISGSSSPTSSVLRPALKLLRNNNGIVSSFFFMEKEKNYFFFADCAVNILPDEKQLASIAIETAKSAERLFKIKPRIAFLSFSTHGSGKHPLADKVRKATLIAKRKNPKAKIDGELQVDAALFPKICQHKTGKCLLKKPANVLIFPDLQSGNISYKLVEWLGHYKAIGPIIQGLKQPVNDLSRGCTVEDIVAVTAITVLEANK